MGWKKIKEHYRIGHIVQVTPKGICIGSPYIHDLIVIGLDGEIIKDDDGRSNEDLKRYLVEMRADPKKLRELAQAPDTFEENIPVYTYKGGKIIEKMCEEPGWPNVTHDGMEMYENTFSLDKNQVVAWAKQNAAAGIENAHARIEDIGTTLEEWKARLQKRTEELSMLEADYPGQV